MDKKIILASNSPRRRELLAGLDLDFEVKVIKGIDESYPDTLAPEKVAQYIASKKAVNAQPEASAWLGLTTDYHRLTQIRSLRLEIDY